MTKPRPKPFKNAVAIYLNPNLARRLFQVSTQSNCYVSNLIEQWVSQAEATLLDSKPSETSGDEHLNPP